MSSRDLILNKIKAGKPKFVHLPEVLVYDLPKEDLFLRFKESINSVGGDAFILNSKQDLVELIKKEYPSLQKIASTIPFEEENYIDPNSFDNPCSLEDLDLAIVSGEFAIAENGAVWIKESKNRHRALYFIVENLIIVVEKNRILPVMADAYDRINFDEAGYGTFISGPSKTADIEQSLVIGAHGPKSGIVVFI